MRRPSPYLSLYNTPEWKAERKAFLRLHPRCDCEEHKGRLDAPKSECVDHVQPHRGDRALFFDQRNWRAMAWRCHTAKTNRQDGGFGNKRRSYPTSVTKTGHQ